MQGVGERGGERWESFDSLQFYCLIPLLRLVSKCRYSVSQHRRLAGEWAEEKAGLFLFYFTIILRYAELSS